MSGSKISGLVFLDMNADGIDESGDNGVGGLTVSLYSSAGVFVSSVVSATDGSYAFANLAAGSYYVKVTPATGESFSPVGGSATLPDSSVNASGQTPTVALTGSNSVVQNAGVYVPVSISGTVFSDANDDGLVDGGDKGIAGATVQLLNGAGQATGATATTDANGNYTFSNLAPGSYAVQVVMPSSEPAGTVYSPYGSNTPPQPTDGAVNQQQNLLVNGSFDDGEPINGLGTTAAGFQGWTMSVNGSSTPYGSGPGNGPEIDFTNSVTNTAIDPLSHTNQFAGVVAPDNANPNYAGGSGTHAAFFVDDGAIETLSQTVNLVAGQTYEVGFDLDETLPGTANPGFFQLSASIGGMTIVTASSTSGTHLTPGTWTHFADLYTPTVSGPVTLTFAYQSGVLGSTETAKDVLVDDVYVVKGQVTPNLTPTSEVNTGGATATFTLTSGQTIGDESAGVYTPPATIKGNVFTDLNADGAAETGDAGVAGVTVGLYSGSTLVATTTTDSSGNYLFNKQSAGTYTVKVSPPAGEAFSPTGSSTTYADSNVNSSGAASVTVANGGVAVANAGVYTPITVKGTVFNDVNADGAQENTDAGVNTVTVQLLSASGAVLASTTTNSSGAYSFANQLPGSYEIKVVAPTGETFSPMGTSATLTDSNVAGTGVTAAFTATSGQTAIENAGLYAPATISGTVFTDANADGAQQTGDAGLAGVTVQLLNSAGAVVGSTVTNSNGQYSATVVPGSYTVQVVLPNGDKFSPAGSSTTLTDSNVSSTGASAVALSSGGSATVNAGIYVPASIVGTIFTDLNDDGAKEAGDPSVSGQTVKLLGADGRTVVATTTTDANGNYSFTNLTPGSYTVQTAAPAGESFSPNGSNASLPDSTIGANGTQSVTLTSGSAATVNAGEFAPGSVAGTVYNDLNGDSAQEGGEPGLSGQTVALLGANGQVIATTTTGANGAYAFNGVTPGSDTVQFTAGTGYALTTPSSVAVTISSGGSATANAGEDAPSTISGTVFTDLNGNGVKDPGDTGFAGQIVTLVNAGGAVLQTATTSASGAYSFTGVAPGSDTVQFAPANGYALTTPASVAVTPTSGSATTNVNAGEDAPATIRGVVFNDLNGDGVDDGSDPGLGGQIVQLLDSHGAVLQTATTSASGAYSFTGVAPGTDTVAFTPANGFAMTTPQLVTVVSTSGMTTSVYAGEDAPSAISGTVFTDNNADGIIDGADSGFGGQIVKLVGSNGTVLQTATTSASGAYSFTGVAPGADKVVFTAANGYALTTPASVAVTTTSGSSTTNVNAGEDAPSTISGTVFTDFNADGIDDGSDSGLGGQIVKLVGSNGSVLQTATTSASGAYSFTGVAPGSDTVQFTPANGYALTTPASVAVTTTSGSSATVNAGEDAPSTISGTVFKDLNGNGIDDGSDTGFAGQIVTLKNSSGTVLQTATTSASGAYSFTGVAPGSDTVQFTPANGYALTTPASVAVTTTSGSSATVNAGEDAPSTISGTVFKDLNGNGIDDGSDTGFAGQIVTLKNSSGTVLQTATTSASGAYSFTGVAPGSDTVQFTAANGYALTTAGSVAVTPISGSSTTNVNAGEDAPSTISGTVFTDNNADGIEDGGDAGLGGQIVKLVGSNGTVLQTATTSASGAYSFTGVAPGNDTVQFTAAAGDTLTTPASVAVAVSSGSSSTVNAGEYAHSTINGTVYTDFNADGIEDGADAGLAGQIVTLKNSSGTVLQTATTSASGAYSFTGVAPGNDTVQFTAANGYALTTAGSVAVTVVSGGSATVNAGEDAPSTISGTVFKDLNGDGTDDGSDTGFAGQVVKLVGSTGTVLQTATTSASGAYSFTGVAPGSDTVQFTAANGYALTTAGSVAVAPVSGSATTGVNAGEDAPSTISGTVFTDNNADGVENGSDSGLGGQIVQLVGSNGSVLQTATTSASGAYSFTGVAPGSDTVQFTPTSGYGLTTPASVAVTPISGSSATVNAGEDAPSTISGTVFIDQNADGIEDGGDGGFAGQIVALKNSSGAVLQTATTSASGAYSFTGVAPGSDTVQFTAANGYGLTTAGSVAVTPTSGSSITGVNAGEDAPSTISGTVFNDLNADGTQEGGEPGLTGQTVNLLGANGQVIATTTTGAGGAYSFGNVAPGSDTVQIVGVPGDTFTTPSSVPVTISSGGSATVNAGEYAPSTITGTVFNDLNGDGVQEPGDLGLSGQTVNLLGSNNQVIATTTTGTNGAYSFGNVVPGSDTVQVVGVPGDTFTTAGAGSTPVTVTSGSATNVQTGEFAPGTISGTVFNDLNADGAQEPGEPGLGGQTVNLLGAGGAVLATTGTNPDGAYSFGNVAPGADTVQFVAAPGDAFTTPSSVPVTMVSGGSATANAGEFAGSTITGTVFNDLNGDGAQETGEPGLVGQTVNLLGSNGQVIATTTTGANGAYNFGNVVPGSDTVQVVGIPGDTFTTGGGGETPVTVTSGSAANVTTGEYAPSTITGTVFNDLNGDSTQEQGEPGLAGQTVVLVDANGQTIATTTTNASGVYAFNNVVPGLDSVQFVAAPGNAFSTPSSDPVTVTSGSTTTVNAGEVAPSTITGVLFLDANGNGAQDPTDGGISGQTVNLLDASGNLLATTTTGANGSYSFTGVAPGADVVAIVAPAGDSFSLAGTSATLTDSNVSIAGIGGVTVTSGSANTVNAGVYAPASFAVHVYDDANIDALQDNGEVGISGVPVQLLNGSGTAIVAVGTTGSNGTVTFTGLAPGSYEAQISNPLAYTVTQAVNVGTPLTVTSGQTAQAIEGLLAPPPGQIDGHVFVNTACTGLYQVGDANVAGVTVELLSGSGTPFTQNGTIITTTTDANGNYSFTSIAAGYYQEKFILPTGLSFTTQRAGTDDTINSAPDQTTGVTGVFLLAGGEDDTTENAGVYLNGKSAANTAVVQAGTAVSFNTGGTLVLGAGNDNIHTTTGNNAIIIGSQGSDGGNIVETGSGTDIVYSCSSLNAQALGSGANPASNLGFSDYLFGGTGTNDLQGGAGSDYLMGGPGVNLIAGGSGTSEVIAGSNSAGYGVVTRGAGGAISSWTVNNEIRPGNGASTIVYQKGDGVMLLDTFKPGLDAMTIYGYPAGTTGTFTTANGHTVLDLGGNDIIVFNDTYAATSGGITFSTSTAPLLVLHFDANGMPYFSAPTATPAAVGETVTFDPSTVTKQATVTGAGGQALTLGFSSAALASQAAAQLAIVNAAIANGSMVAEEVVNGVLPILPAAIAGLAEIDTTGAVYLGAGYTTSVDTASGPTTVLAAAAGNHLIMASNSTGALLYAGDTGADTVYAGAGDGLIFGGGASLNFLGGSGAATIIGGTAGNTVTGGGGSQLIFGSTTLNYTGGTGAATIIGGGGGNTVTGGAGNELIFASSSMTYNGGAGAATLIGGGGPLNANLGAGGGLAYGGPGGGNTLASGSGTSILVGGGNGDLLTATGSGNDTLVAGAGNETLDGSASTGNLVLFGGPGSDSITGGSGGNLFIAESGNETLTAAGTSNSIVFIATPGATRTDVINGFNPNHDAIGLFGYGSGADAAALASLTTSGGNTNLTLSDGTRIIFTGAPTLHSYNFF